MIEVIKNIDELELVKDDINLLADSFKMPLLRYEWLKNTALNFCPPGRLNFIILREHNGIKAVAPLVLVPGFHSEKLEIIGASFHKEPGGFLFKDIESLEILIEEILKLKKPLFFNGIRMFSPESLSLDSILMKNKNYSFKHNASIPFLPLTGNWDDFYGKISSSRRSSLRRLERIAREMGDYKIEILSPTENEVDQYIEEIFNVEAAGWKGRTGTAMKYNPRLGTFFRNYSRDAAKCGFLRFLFLRINSEAIAAQIGIVYANRFWTLKIGYNESWSKCSPGILLMNEMIRYAFENKLEAIELLGSNENWLHIWTNYSKKLITYRIYHSPVSSASDLLIEYSSLLFKRIKKQHAKDIRKEHVINAKV